MHAVFYLHESDNKTSDMCVMKYLSVKRQLSKTSSFAEENLEQTQVWTQVLYYPGFEDSKATASCIRGTDPCFVNEK